MQSAGDTVFKAVSVELAVGMEVRSVARSFLFDGFIVRLKDILNENATTCQEIQLKIQVTMMIDVTRKILISGHKPNMANYMRFYQLVLST